MKSMKYLAIALVAWSGVAYAGTIKTIQAGATDQTVTVKIIDADDGLPVTTAAFDTSGIDLEYWRHGANAATDITEATQTANGAHSDGGFVHIGHGIYRLDLPDAAVAAGATAVEVYGTITGMIVIGGTVDLSPPANVVQFGGTNGTFATGRPEVNTTHIAGSAVSTSSAQIGVNVVNAGGTAWGSGAITANVIATDAIGELEVADGAINAGALASDTITAAKIASDVSTEINANVLTALGIQTGTVTISSQTSFTLSAGSADDNAYNDWAILIIDQSTAAQKALGVVDDYTGASKTVTLREDPGVFTMATGDSFVLMPAFLAAAIDANVVSAESTDYSDYIDTVTGTLSTFDPSSDQVELSSDGVASIRDMTVEDQGGGVSLGCVLAVLAAYAAGDVSTTGDDSLYQDPSGTETRIEGTAATPGDRTVTITCPSY
jgi:hypothetical protein